MRGAASYVRSLNPPLPREVWLLQAAALAMFGNGIVVPFLVMLEVLSRSGRKLSELLAPFFERYFLTGEINTPVADVPLKLQQLKERYAAAGGRISHLDGLSVEFDDWHFNVRPSNTEPLLRLNLEALSQDEMETRRDEVLELIRS